MLYAKTARLFLAAVGIALFMSSLMSGATQAQTGDAANANGGDRLRYRPNPGGSEGYFRLVEAAEAFWRAAGDEAELFRTLPESSAEAKRIRQRYARRTASALNLARAAIKMPFREPPVTAYDMRFPEMAGFRQLARGFMTEAKVNADEGKFFRAASSGAASVEMGVQIPHGGKILSAVIGYACEAIGRKSVWQVTERLDAKSARSILRRLQIIETNRALVRETILQEKEFSLTMLRKLMTDAMNGAIGTSDGETNDTSDKSTPSAPAAESPDSTEPGETQEPIPELTPERIDAFLKRQSELYDALIVAAEQPYSSDAEEKALAAFAPSEDNITFPVDGMMQSIVPMFQGLHFKEVGTRTYATLQIVALALQAYRKEHGDFPPDLRDLTKGDADTGKNKILARIPVDPFSPKNQTVRYRRLSRAKYLLYSVGPDGKDDNGKPLYSVGELTEQEKAGKPITAWNSDQRGDMVVGVNVGQEMFKDAPPAPAVSP